jgi:hypothetical protein
LASASGALLLQGGFLLLLLYSMPQFEPRQKLEREMTLILPRLSAPTPLPKKAPSTNGNKPLAPALVVPVVPEANAPILPPPVIPIVPPAAIQGFGQALNNCAPENYANLSEEQRARCLRPGAGVAIQQAPNLLGSPSHVGESAHWATELAARNTPARVDCTHLETQNFGPAAQGYSLIVDPLCVLKHVQERRGLVH